MTLPKRKHVAEEVIKKLDDGGDFAVLAKEYSEDPGSKEKGGLYEDVKMKQMAPEFEKAALALEPGTYSKSLVETNFGYHIIKLESKKEGKDEQGNPASRPIMSVIFLFRLKSRIRKILSDVRCLLKTLLRASWRPNAKRQFWTK